MLFERVFLVFFCSAPDVLWYLLFNSGPTECGKPRSRIARENTRQLGILYFYLLNLETLGDNLGGDVRS